MNAPTDTPNSLQHEYRSHQAQNLQLDMTRGKPCPEQLTLSDAMLAITKTRAADGTDCRNYGGLLGLPEARAFFAEYLKVSPGEVIVGGNSSLALMHDLVMNCLTRKLWGEPGTSKKFLCPVPGYDRHFSICQNFGIEMIPVAMDHNGPDMNAVTELVKDPSVVGMWCVPKYSNPSGATYSPQVVKQLASMKTGNFNFRIFWDNAYDVHHLSNVPARLFNINYESHKHYNGDRVFIFGSTSKITFAGSGVSAVAMSDKNVDWYQKSLQAQTIGPDKLNQLRHVLFLQNMETVQTHMEGHRNILVPKFNAVDDELTKGLGNNKDMARWNKPDGGYFINLDVKPGCARRVVQLANEAGVKLTPAGATFPYGKDPHDSNIRIAPSFPSIRDIRAAIKVLVLCIKIAAIEKKD